MATGAQVWSTSAASNASADSAVNWAEGMAPSAVNNSARGEMASVASWIGDNSGTLVTSGSSAAFTVTSKQVQTAVTDGYTITVRFHATNDSAATLNVDSVAAKNIQKYAGTNVTGGEFQAGSIIRFTYHTSSTAWVAQGFNQLTSVSSLAVTNALSAGSVTASSLATTNDANVGGALVVGTSVTGSSAATFSGTISGGAATGGMMATQSDQETGTATTRIVAPGTQQYHPSAAKAWATVAVAGSTPSLNNNYNCTSVTDLGAGFTRVNFTNAFSSTDYCAVASAESTSAQLLAQVGGKATGSVIVVTSQAGVVTDNITFNVVCFGDQ